MMIPLFLSALFFVLTRADDYSEDTAIETLYLARVVNCERDVILNWTCSLCPARGHFTNVSVIDDSDEDFRAYVALRPSDGLVVVSFRGTVDGNMADMIADITITLKAPWSDLPDVKVHQGFYDSYSKLRDGVFAAVQNLAPVKKTLRVTGHSLGAGQATLFAFELERLYNIQVDDVYTYGQPRTGNKAFATRYTEQFANRNWRLTHWRDAAPLFPARALGYQHAAREVFYSEPNVLLRICDGSGEDPLCSDQFPVGAISPHDHVSYLNQTISGGHCPTNSTHIGLMHNE